MDIVVNTEPTTPLWGPGRDFFLSGGVLFTWSGIITDSIKQKKITGRMRRISRLMSPDKKDLRNYINYTINFFFLVWFFGGATQFFIAISEFTGLFFFLRHLIDLFYSVLLMGHFGSGISGGCPRRSAGFSIRYDWFSKRPRRTVPSCVYECCVGVTVTAKLSQ